MPKTLDFRRPHLLRNEAEYAAALVEVEALMLEDPRKGTADYDRALFLGVLVEAYEAEHFPTEDVSPQDVVEFALEQKGMDRADLAGLMGGKARVSEFFAGKRGLSINQVRTLRDALGIPADLLIAGS